MSTLTDLAAKLAEDTVLAMQDTGNDRLYMEVASVLGASSQTLEEAYLTEIRVRLAERGARAFLERKWAAAKATKPAGPTSGSDAQG